jgi:hypothetical protein
VDEDPDFRAMALFRVVVSIVVSVGISIGVSKSCFRLQRLAGLVVADCKAVCRIHFNIPDLRLSQWIGMARALVIVEGHTSVPTEVKHDYDDSHDNDSENSNEATSAHGACLSCQLRQHGKSSCGASLIKAGSACADNGGFVRS